MSGSDKDSGSPSVDPAAGPAREEEVDEELLALAPPPPSIRQALFVGFVLALTIVMLVWFSPELRYFLRSFEGPTHLGEAPDIDTGSLSSHTYVSINGLPMINETLVFNEGVKWFAQSDTERKMFSLSGQPDIFVQWAMPDEHKAYRDPEFDPVSPPLPAFFEGHLIRRGEIGPNFDKVWVFFDCLNVHTISRCKYCLGRTSMDSCREAFTCLERNTPEQCGELLERSADGLASEIGDLENKVSRGESPQENRKRIAHLTDLELSLREQGVAVKAVRLEEMSARADRLLRMVGIGEREKRDLESIRTEVLGLQFEDMTTRAGKPASVVDSFKGDDRAQLDLALERYRKLVEAEPAKIEDLKAIQAVIEIGNGLERLKERLAWLDERIVKLDPAHMGPLKKLKLDPDKSTGAEILAAVEMLEYALSKPPEPREEIGADAGPTDERPGTDIDEIDEPDAGRTALALRAVASRADSLQDRVAFVEPGAIPDFDKWATKSNTVLHLCRSTSKDGCKIPKGLRTDEIIGALDRLEKMLEGVVVVDGEVPALSSKLDQGIDDLDEIRKGIRELEARSGMVELEVMEPLHALEKSIASLADEPGGAPEVTRELEQVRRMMMERGFYSTQLKGMPRELAAIEKTLDAGILSKLDERLDALAATIDRSDWVLVDGDVPIDNIWVLFIYLLLVVMIVINVKKLWRFWLAWRA
jgi:hypothetical protein